MPFFPAGESPTHASYFEAGPQCFPAGVVSKQCVTGVSLLLFLVLYAHMDILLVSRSFASDHWFLSCIHSISNRLYFLRPPASLTLQISEELL